MSASPDRATYDDPVDIEALQRTIERREEARRVTDAQFATEKRQFERRAETLQMVLSDADDQLARRSAHVAAVAKESAATTAESTRQLTARTSAAAKLSSDVQSQQQAIDESAARNEELEAFAAAQRAALAQAQVTAEDRVQQSAAVSRQFNDEVARQQSLASALQAQRDSHHPERRKLEARAAEVQQRLGGIADATREVQTNIPAAEARRNERRAQLRRSIDGQRERSADDASMVRSLRQLLTELSDGQEEAARRRRKGQEEEARDRVAARRQASQAHGSHVAELERRIRAKTESMVSEAQTETAQLALDDLPRLRDEARALFDRELELRDEIAHNQRKALGIEAITERVAVANEQQGRLVAAIDDLIDQCEVASATVAERERRVQAVTDAVAPLQDVEKSCSELAARQRELSKKLSDDSADHAIWRVRADDLTGRMNAEIEGLQGEVRLLEEKKVSEQATLDVQANELESTLRQLELESKNLTERIDEFEERNTALDATLEHIGRQRRAMAEEMAERRNAARAAAASLLSQLE